MPVICPQIPSLMVGGIWGQRTGGLPSANPVRIGTDRSDDPRSPQARHTRQSSPGHGARDAVRVSGCGTPSNRAGWSGKVWKGRRALPFRCALHRRGLPSAGALPRRDRTQSSEPQVESLHKCALHCFSAQGLRQTVSVQVQTCPPVLSCEQPPIPGATSAMFRRQTTQTAAQLVIWDGW